MSKQKLELAEELGKKREALEFAAELGLSRLDASIETCFTCGTQRLLASRIASLASEYCFLGSTYARFDGDFAAADRQYQRCLALVPVLFEILARFERQVPLSLPPNYNENLEAARLQWFMVGVMMAGQPQQTVEAATLLLHRRVVGHERYPYEKFMAACVLGEEALARKLAGVRCDMPLQRSLDGIGQAIVDSDQAAFDTLLLARVDAFVARTRMRTYDEHGCTKFANRVQLDTFGIAMCQIALAQGLRVNVQADFYPSVYLRAWNS